MSFKQSVYNLLMLVFAAAARKLEGHGDRSLKTTFGWARVGVVGSLTSLAFLASLSFATGVEALQTLAHSDHLDTMHQSFWVGVLAGCHFLVWTVVFALIGGERILRRIVAVSNFCLDALFLTFRVYFCRTLILFIFFLLSCCCYCFLSRNMTAVAVMTTAAMKAATLAAANAAGAIITAAAAIPKKKKPR